MFWVGTVASSAVNAWGFVQNGLESSYGCIRTVLQRLFNIWRSIFFIEVQSLQNFRKSKMSSSLEWRFETQTHRNDRKTTTSARLVGLPAHNFGFSGEFRVYTNDPEEMSRNLSVQIENLS